MSKLIVHTGECSMTTTGVSLTVMSVGFNYSVAHVRISNPYCEKKDLVMELGERAKLSGVTVYLERITRDGLVHLIIWDN